MKRLFSFVAIATIMLLASCTPQNEEGSGSNNNTETFDVEFTATNIYGYYYGQKYGEGSECYAFYLSKAGFNNGSQAFPNESYYYVVVYSPVLETTSLPLGTYNYDSNNTKAIYTIENGSSMLINTADNAEDTTYTEYTAAKMVVAHNKIVLEVTVDGKRHKVTYFGDLNLKDADSQTGNDDPTGGQDGQAQSTLTSDHNVTFQGEHRAKWLYEGDYWQTGYSNYTIYIMNKNGGSVYGDTLQFDIITDNNSTDGKFAGKYKISNTPGKMVMVAGFTNKYAQAVGSWYYEYGGGSASGYKNYAMIKSGEAEFIDNGDGTHTVILDGYDYLNNNITCNWTGVIEED